MAANALIVSSGGTVQNNRIRSINILDMHTKRKEKVRVQLLLCLSVKPSAKESDSTSCKCKNKSSRAIRIKLETASLLASARLTYPQSCLQSGFKE